MRRARHTPELESTVYRLVQESLTNAVRHAGASRVRIEVTERDGFIEVAVADDGKGFDPAARATGFGLTGMRERVALAAGELDIQTAPGGTTIRARLPARRGATDRTERGPVRAPFWLRGVQSALGEPAVPLDHRGPRPALSEAEGLVGSDGGEADQDERVDDVIVHEQVVLRRERGGPHEHEHRRAGDARRPIAMPSSSATPIASRPTMNSTLTTPAPAMLW